MRFASNIRLLLLTLWLGAAVFFIVVAQSAFAVLPQREMAGAVVGRTLSFLNYSGLGIAVILLLSSFIGSALVSKFWLWIERFLLLILAAACGIGQFVIGFMLISVRAQMAGRPIDELAIDDPLRIQFNALHEYSVWVLFAGMAAAFIVYFIIAGRTFNPVSSSSAADPYNFKTEFKI